MYVMQGQILYWLRCFFYFRKPIIIFNLTSLQRLQQHTSVPKMATVLFPCNVRLQSSRGTTALNFKLRLGIVLIILSEINVTKIDLLRKVLYLFQNYRLYMMLSIFWTERKFVVDDSDFIFFSQVFQQFKMTLLKLEMSQRNSFWVRNELLRWTLGVQLIFSPRKANFEEFC